MEMSCQCPTALDLYSHYCLAKYREYNDQMMPKLCTMAINEVMTPRSPALGVGMKLGLRRYRARRVSRRHLMRSKE
jgi:hypothetical protein